MDGLKKAIYSNGEYVEYTYDYASRLICEKALTNRVELWHNKNILRRTA